MILGILRLHHIYKEARHGVHWSGWHDFMKIVLGKKMFVMPRSNHPESLTMIIVHGTKERSHVHASLSSPTLQPLFSILLRNLAQSLSNCASINLNSFSQQRSHSTFLFLSFLLLKQGLPPLTNTHMKKKSAKNTTEQCVFVYCLKTVSFWQIIWILLTGYRREPAYQGQVIKWDVESTVS